MGLAPGTKLVARTVITEDGVRYYSDPVWSERLATLGEALIADIAGIDLPVAGIAERRALHLKTGALVAIRNPMLPPGLPMLMGCPSLLFASWPTRLTGSFRTPPWWRLGRMVRLRLALSSARSSKIRAKSRSSCGPPMMRARLLWLYSAAERCLPGASAFVISASFARRAG